MTEDSTASPTPLCEPRIVEGEVNFAGEGMIGPAKEVTQEEQPEEHFEGSEVMIAVPQMLNGKVTLVIVGQARVMRGVKLAVDELKLEDE